MSGTQRAPQVRLEGLSRRVGRVALLDDITFEIGCCEVVALVGSSGAGKSSLLRLINRLDEPSSGTVYLNGEDYRSMPPRQLRRRVGMVMQAPYLFPGTVADNLRFGPRQRGEELPTKRIEELLERVGLAGYAGRDALTGMSGGEAQRVSLARTLANSPEVLLLDEPTSALDERIELEVEALVAGIIREEELTCLIVTHDMVQASRLAGRVVVLEKGRVARTGTVGEVFRG